MFKSLLKDKITLVKEDGNKFENIEANVQPKLITVFNETIPFESGDVIERVLPNGISEKFNIIDPTFYQKIGGLPGHYQIKVEKVGINEKLKSINIQNNFYGNLNNSPIQQQTNNSQQNISYSYELNQIKQIEDNLEKLGLGENKNGFELKLRELKTELVQGNPNNKIKILAKNLIDILKDTASSLLAAGAIQILTYFLK